MDQGTNLPFPDSRSGWATAIVSSFLLFLMFYTFGYPLVDNLYRRQYLRSGDSVAFESVKLQVELPRFVSSSVDRDLRIWVENQSDQPVEIKIKILTYLARQGTNLTDTDQEEQSIATGVLVSSQAENNSIQDGTDIINFGVIPQQARVFKSVRFRLPESQDGEIIRFRFMVDNGEKIVMAKIMDISSITHNPSSIIVELMKSILLPPLSNGLIPLVVLFCAYSLDDILVNKPTNRWHARSAVFFRAFFILMILSSMLWLYLLLVNLYFHLHVVYLIFLSLLAHWFVWIAVNFTRCWADICDNIDVGRSLKICVMERGREIWIPWGKELPSRHENQLPTQSL